MRTRGLGRHPHKGDCREAAGSVVKQEAFMLLLLSRSCEDPTGSDKQRQLNGTGAHPSFYGGSRLDECGKVTVSMGLLIRPAIDGRYRHSLHGKIQQTHKQDRESKQDLYNWFSLVGQNSLSGFGRGLRRLRR